MISMAQAKAIAEAAAMAAQIGFTVNKVCRWHEISGSRPVLYLPQGRVESTWIAYIRDVGPAGIGPSKIVVVDDKTGEVVYVGSANDEG